MGTCLAGDLRADPDLHLATPRFFDRAYTGHPQVTGLMGSAASPLVVQKFLESPIDGWSRKLKLGALGGRPLMPTTWYRPLGVHQKAAQAQMGQDRRWGGGKRASLATSG